MSITGVPVMPSGSMFPHGSFDRDTGKPSDVRHFTAPVAASSAYTESFSVATYTALLNTRGSA